MTLRARIHRKNNDDINMLCSAFMDKAKKYSYIHGVFDDDLYSEQLLAMFKGIRRFRFNEEEFNAIYDRYIDDIESEV